MLLFLKGLSTLDIALHSAVRERRPISERALGSAFFPGVSQNSKLGSLGLEVLGYQTIKLQALFYFV